VPYLSLLSIHLKRGLIGGMIVGGATGAVVGHYTAKKQFESMAAAQAQQTQIEQAQAQAASTNIPRRIICISFI